MIREQIKGTDRKLVSLESNLEWLNKYTHLANASHQLYHVDANNDDCIETGNVWVDFVKIVFIDSSPWLSRKCCFDYFLDKAKIIIFHDFDYFPVNNIIGNVIEKHTLFDKEKISCNLNGIVKNYKLFYPPYEYFAGNTGPPTLICSNIMDNTEFNSIIRDIENNLHLYY